MVFTLIVAALKGKKIGITCIGLASDLALCSAPEQFALDPKDVTMIAREDGYKECSNAISSPPYPGMKGFEAVRDSLLDSTPQLKNLTLAKTYRRSRCQNSLVGVFRLDFN